MTIKEFKELVLEAEKKGEINENSEVFILDEEDQVMSKLFNSEDVLTPFNFEKSKDLLNKLCYFGSSKTELIANIVKDNKMLLSQKFDGGIDCYCAENNEWYSFCIPCYKVKAKEIE